MKQGYVYLLASKAHGTLYVGVTSDLVKRVYEHKNGLVEGFTKTYGIKDLVYFEVLDDMGPRLSIVKNASNGGSGIGRLS